MEIDDRSLGGQLNSANRVVSLGCKMGGKLVLKSSYLKAIQNECTAEP